MEIINYKLDQFEGPLDLLLTLIIKHKINIDDIPISLLCEQYMMYIQANLDMEIEVASEFLYMASELMLIKSRMLLPRNTETEEDPRMSLRDTVLEYQRAKLAAAELSDLFAVFGGRMVKEQDDISPDRTYVAPHDAELLRNALIHAMTETHITQKNNTEIFDPIVNQPHVPVQLVTSDLLDKLRQSGKVYLDKFFRQSVSHSEQIAKFLSILELLKTQYISLQEETLSDATEAVNLSGHVYIVLTREPDTEFLEALAEYS
ncbi:MAG: segregation/condensation protein A [Clostridia bacterium]|nr:segregation/condensation protein A [Clostridia bacterium]